MSIKSKIGSFFLSLVIVVAVFSSCAKKSTPSPTTTTPAPTPASLQITVTDVSAGFSTASPNPKVQLFKTDNDRANKTNPVTPLVTGDANGIVLFDSLSAIVYYFNAYSNDLSKSNANGGTHTSPLTAGTLNKLGISIK